MVGSRKAEELARRDELMASQRADVKELKKAAAEYSKRRQAIFQEMLESISLQEPDASSDEDNVDDAFDEEGGLAASSASSAFGHSGGRRGFKKGRNDQNSAV